MAKSKKIGKISPQTKASIPNPFSISTHKTERTAVAILMHWMRAIIESRGIDLGLPDVETGGTDRRFPDTVIYKTRRSQDVLCVMEFKPPQWDPFNSEDPKPLAVNVARKAECRRRRRTPQQRAAGFRCLVDAMR